MLYMRYNLYVYISTTTKRGKFYEQKKPQVFVLILAQARNKFVLQGLLRESQMCAASTLCGSVR